MTSKRSSHSLLDHQHSLLTAGLHSRPLNNLYRFHIEAGLIQPGHASPDSFLGFVVSDGFGNVVAIAARGTRGRELAREQQASNMRCRERGAFGDRDAAARPQEGIKRLDEAGARYRGRPRGEPLLPSRQALEGSVHSPFVTDLGPLDVLGEIEDGLSYDDLVPESVTVEIAGNDVRVLALAAIVRNKRGSTHPKDQRVLAVLEEPLWQLEGNS